DEIRNMTVMNVHPAKDVPSVLEQFEKQVRNEIRTIANIPVLRKDGSIFYADISANPMSFGGKTYVMGLFHDVSERKEKEEQIRAALHEKEVLLKEVHHRVKNNLQIIESMLRMQSKAAGDEKAEQIFKESRNRIRAMAAIHTLLYQSGNLANIDFKEYIRSLVKQLFRSYNADPGAISLVISTSDLLLSIDTAIPCSLIINELVSNALKHAFPEGRKGELRISLRKVAESESPNDARESETVDLQSEDQTSGHGLVELIVSDNGVGFSEGKDLSECKTMGLVLVKMLVEQLDGNIEMFRNGGTRFVIRFRTESHYGGTHAE
ncbi:MAG TPA: histidine kinase dimerization/phosphoacceptor domain -containing protein, partial [Thermodesulfovibrionales bacterium]|nr:histidine kinase dimerization/phosphoacceptor domain -containing protein [Thermodesulfovibrionales bacterium]